MTDTAHWFFSGIFVPWWGPGSDRTESCREGHAQRPTNGATGEGFHHESL